MNRTYYGNHGTAKTWVRLEHSPKQKEALEESGLRIHNIHVFFFLAYIEIMDFVDMLDDEKIEGVWLYRYRKKVEQLCNDYTRQMKMMYGKREYNLLFDLGRSFHTQLQHDLQILRLAFKNHMLNSGVKYQDIIAQMQVCITLAELSVDIYKQFFEKYNKLVGYDISVGYRWMRIDKVCLNLKRISEEIGKRTPNTIDFSSSEQCQMAFTVICNKINQGEAMEESAYNALNLNNIKHE